MIANNGKSYFPYLNKLVDQCNDTYHHSINKKPNNADHSALTEKIETKHKAPKFKVNDRVRIFLVKIITKNIFSKGYSENWSREILFTDSVLQTNPWTYKNKDLTGEKIIGSFCEKELLSMSYYPEPDGHIRDKVKIVLDLSNYATKKELDHAIGVDTSDLAAKIDFIALKSEVDKLDINKLVNFPTSLNNLKTKVYDLDVAKLKSISLDLQKLSDAVDNEVIKNTKFNTLKTKGNNLEKKIPDATTLIHINQNNTDKQNLEKKIRDLDNK